MSLGPQRTTTTWQWVRRLAPWVFTVAIVALFVTQISLDDVRLVLDRFSWPWYLVGLLFYIATNFLRAWRTWLFLGKQRRELPLLFPVFFVISLANNGLPARLGEVAYVYFVDRLLNIGVGATTAGLIVVRVFDYLMVVVLFLSSWFGASSVLSLEGQQVALLAVPILTAGVAVLVALPWIGDRLFALGAAVLGRLHLTRLADLANREGGRAVETLRLLRTPAQYLQMIGTTAGIWLFTYLWFTSFLIACGYETAYSLVIFGATFAVLSKAIPLASIGGFGTHEAGWAMGFMLVGNDFQAAILSGLAINILTLAASMLFGIPSLLLLLSIFRLRRQPVGHSDLS